MAGFAGREKGGGLAWHAELLIQRAKKYGGSVVLPEGQDPRVMKAAAEVARRGFARVSVLATPAEAQQACAAAGVIPSGFEIIDPTAPPCFEELVAAYHRKRAAKGLTEEQARAALKNRLYIGAIMIETGYASGMVAGSIASTPDMLRAAFHCVGTAPGIKTASSCFLLRLKTPTIAGESTLLFADCGVNPNPTAEQLAEIVLEGIGDKRIFGVHPGSTFMDEKAVGQDGLHQPVDVVVVGMGHVHGKIPGKALGVKEGRGPPPHVRVAFRDQKIRMTQLV